MATENTVRAFTELKQIYMDSVAPKDLVEARKKLTGGQGKLDVEPKGGDGDIDSKDLAALRRRAKLRNLGLNEGEHNSEPSLQATVDNALAISGKQYSNWREEVSYVTMEAVETNEKEDDTKEIKINKKIKNTISINPTISTLQEAFVDYDLEVVESTELEEESIIEAAQVATEYFYESGLNEYGVEELIESLGENKFVDFVFDLIEDYELNEENLLEWRRGPDGSKVRGDQTTKSGKHFKDVKGGAKTSAAKATSEAKSRKAEKEVSSTGSKVGSELSNLSNRSKQLRRASVETKTAEVAKKPENVVKTSTPQAQQKTKKGILNTIAGAILKGAERHQNAMKATRPHINNAAKAAGTVAGTVAGAATAIRRVGKEVENSQLAKKGRKVAGAVAKGAWEGAGHYAKHDSVPRALGHAAGTAVKNLRKEDTQLINKVLDIVRNSK